MFSWWSVAKLLFVSKYDVIFFFIHFSSTFLHVWKVMQNSTAFILKCHILAHLWSIWTYFIDFQLRILCISWKTYFWAILTYDTNLPSRMNCPLWKKGLPPFLKHLLVRIKRFYPYIFRVIIKKNIMFHLPAPKGIIQNYEIDIFFTNCISFPTIYDILDFELLQNKIICQIVLNN